MPVRGKPSAALAWLLVWGATAVAQSDGPARQEPGFAALRQAAAGWERRTGPDRAVVDQVCLVRDLPEFLEAVGTWDDRHYFPILIDQDVERTLRFLRAFRPARIVRYPGKNVEPVARERLWDAALQAVGRAWTADGDAAAARGDRVPESLGATPPAVVLAAPDSPLLAGAVALAAGRFQPLLALNLEKHARDVLSPAEARALAEQVEQVVAAAVPGHDRLGDDCDFLTLAGDWPYRYQTDTGDNALDDLIGRATGSDTRWAIAGRLTGGLAASVYQAMCSLFLQPRSVLLFNSYSERDRPWSGYRMTEAADALRGALAVTHRSGDRASLTGWHEVFDPVNRFGLVLINTHGDPTRFNLPGGPGQSADVPPSDPAAVLMIHSFSAADPHDPDTLAGRWLAQGAFVYYGSINEPYLQAFRPPGFVAALAARRLPLSAAVRQAPPEPFGKPWRLIYLGDPLYRLEPRDRPRLERWGPVETWPAYVEFDEPSGAALRRLNWAVKTAVYRFQTRATARVRSDLAKVLLAIDRHELPEDYRPILDALLADVLLHANRADALLDWFLAIPPAERSAQARRLTETLLASRLQRFVARHDFAGAAELWSQAVAAPAPEDFYRQVTARVAGLAASKTELAEWRRRLLGASRARGSPAAPVIAEELKRAREKLATPSAAR